MWQCLNIETGAKGLLPLTSQVLYLDSECGSIGQRRVPFGGVASEHRKICRWGREGRILGNQVVGGAHCSLIRRATHTAQ